LPSGRRCAGDLIATDDGERDRKARSNRPVARSVRIGGPVAVPVSIGGSVARVVPIIVAVGRSSVAVGGRIADADAAAITHVAAAITGAAAANLAYAGNTAGRGAAHGGSTAAVAASDARMARSRAGSRVTACGILRSRRLGGDQQAAHSRGSGKSN
jgi:hypothetical protein